MAEKVIEPLDNRIAVLKSRLDSVFVSRERAQTDIEIKRGLINQTEKEIMQLCNQIEIYSSSF